MGAFANAWMKDPGDAPWRLAITQIFGTHKDLPSCMGILFPGMCLLVFNKVEPLEDIYVNKNKFFTKHPRQRDEFAVMMEQALLFMESDDPRYAPKRKALAGAFFKKKLHNMTHTFKEVIIKHIQEMQKDGWRTKDVNICEWTQDL